MPLSNQELISIIGGEFSYSLLNAISKFVGLLYDLGQVIGSSIRYIQKGNKC